MNALAELEVITALDAKNRVALQGRAAGRACGRAPLIGIPRLRGRSGNGDTVPASGTFDCLAAHVPGGFERLVAMLASEFDIRHGHSRSFATLVAETI